MPIQQQYRDQVALLVRTIPHIDKESCFALKGGTAINLFIRDLPRLSVDIDLTYLPSTSREDALKDVEMALKRIAERIKSTDNTFHITESAPATQDTINKLIIRTQNHVQIKIEVTPVLRGCVYKPQRREIVDAVQDEFAFAEMNVLSFEDLYAGKIMAALDRQHPRDLFDVHDLFRNEGIDDNLREAVIVYLISHGNVAHAILDPNLKDISHEYERAFVGMTNEDIALETLTAARENLIADINNNMPDRHKSFLLGFYACEPDWSLLALENIDALPAVQWRLQRLGRAGAETRRELVSRLKEILH